MNRTHVAHVDAEVCLGKLPVKHDDRTLQLARYFTDELGPPPTSVQRIDAVQAIIGPDWGMMLNNQLGDCTIAALGHAEQVWEAIAHGKNRRPSDQVVGELYIPKTGQDDTGRVELDVLNYVHQHGIFHHKLYAYAAIGRESRDNVKHAMDLFGLAYLGVALPRTAQQQLVWDVVSGPGSEPGSWGGHAIIIVDYDSFGPTCITWGKPLKMSWAFYDKYVEEQYALLCSAWMSHKKSPAGFALDILTADLEAIG